MQVKRGFAAVIAAAVAALALPGVASAAAQSDVPDVARLYGISQADAADRLAVERLAGALEADAKRLWPDTFAGAWMDRSGGRTISVAFSDDATTKVAQLAADFPRPLLLRPVHVRRSESELAAVQSRMLADREAARAGRGSLPGVPGAEYSLELDLRRNAVVMIAERPTGATVAEVRRRYGNDVIVEAGSIGGPNACTRDDCIWSLRAGLKAVNANNNYCTTAFTVRRNDNGNRNILSAAHCGGDSYRAHGAQPYGQVLAQQQQYRVDAERHGVGQGKMAARAWNFVDTSNKVVPITSVSTYAGLSGSATVCKSGVTTGKTCGTVSSKTYSPSYVPNGNSFIKIGGMCAKDGDSGAGSYINQQAVGVHSGGDDDQICNNGNDFGITGHIEFAQSALNATVITAEPTTTFDSVSAQGQTNTVTVRFSWPVSCATVAASDFTVRMNGIGITVNGHTCSVDSDPAFSLILASTLLSGTTVEVSLVGHVADPAGSVVPQTTRSATVQ